MVYDPGAFEDHRMRRYAALVAAECASVPRSVISAHEEVRGRFFGLGKRIVLGDTSLDGWILLVDPEEGTAVCNRTRTVSDRQIDAWEHGRLLMLMVDGKLNIARYSQFKVVSFPNYEHPYEGDSARLTATQPASADDVVSFDRLNRGSYQDRKPESGQAWRRELRRNWGIRVPHAGMETSLSLKRLRETQSVVRKLRINF